MNKKTVQQLIILAVIIAAIIGVMVFHSASGHKSNNTTSNVQSITTTFDQSALPDLQTRSTNYPSVAPNSSDQGKTNPFGQ